MSRFVLPTNANDTNIMALLTMLSNPTELRARLEELQTKEEALDAKIALAGPAEDILTLRAEASSLHQQASATLENANLEAQRILREANANIQALKTQAQNEYDAKMLEISQAKTLAETEIKNLKGELERSRTSSLLTLKDEEFRLNQLKLDAENEQKRAQTERNNLEYTVKSLQQKEAMLADKEDKLLRHESQLSVIDDKLKNLVSRFVKEVDEIVQG